MSGIDLAHFTEILLNQDSPNVDGENREFPKKTAIFDFAEQKLVTAWIGQGLAMFFSIFKLYLKIGI